MTTKTFSEFLSKLDQTTLRNEITAILSQLFNKARYQEIDKICYLCLGRLAPPHQSIDFNLAEKSMVKILAYTFNRPVEELTEIYKKNGDLGSTAYQLTESRQKGSLSIVELYRKLVIIANQEGSGSQGRKLKLFSELLKQLDPLTNKYLARIPVGKLRLGFSELTILDALSWLKTKNKTLRPDLERAYNVSADIGLVAKTFKKGGLLAIKKIQPQIGIPIRPALAGRLANQEKIIEKLGTFALEPKYDGFRIQIHFSRQLPAEEKSENTLLKPQHSYVRFFSRQMENTTGMFPDLVKEVERFPVESAILDGEAIGFNPRTGKFLPFQETAQRKRKYDVKKTAGKIPLKVFVFDLLYLNGKPILKKSFKKRRLALEKIFQNPTMKSNQLINLTPQRIIKNKSQIEKYFNLYINQGLEGILCKKLNSSYQAGARDFTWVKYKKTMRTNLADTIDCLVLGYYRGRGKRSGFGIGAFLVGVLDPRNESFLTIAKIGTGLSDDQWRQIRRKVDSLKTKEKPKQYSVPKELTPDVWAKPEIVVEIKSDEISKSPIHSSGYALRFPRMERIRQKDPNQSTSLKEVIQLYKIQTCPKN
ncbi:MAG: ATP-dependent DNA ligase [Patescibacteria group bacterium]|nr:ATP-dependent DNA ligase [Patescibacteria group bacterium]